MSTRITSSEILFLQRILRQDGLYQGALDGIWGPKTSIAVKTKEQLSRIVEDPRSTRNISSLTLATQELAVNLLNLTRRYRVVKIISGTRTYDEQTQLYKQGRDEGSIVTWAKAGQSWHNFGMAIDIGIFENDGSYITADEPYKELGEIITEKLTTDWGGRWRRKDYPHYGLLTKTNITEAKRRFEAGELIC